LAEADLPQALPTDSADVLRIKASRILEFFFGDAVSRDPNTWIDLTEKLASGIGPGDIVTKEDLSMLLDLLQNPGSEIYIKAAEFLFLS